MPERIRLSRTRGWRMPPGAVKVDRTTKWGNPWRKGDGPILSGPDWRDLAHAFFLDFINDRLADPDYLEHEKPDAYPSLDEIRAELTGKDLACWCPTPEPGEPDICHAAVLLELCRGAQ